MLHTDSLIEARGRDGRLLGTEGLLNVVRSLAISEPGGLIPALLKAIEAMGPDNLRHDDVTVLLFTPNRQPIRWRDHLLAPIRVAGDLLSRMRGSAVK